MNRLRLVGCSLLLLLLSAISAFPQGFTADARLVAMGGVGGHSNGALELAGNARSYRSIGIPIGLFQVFKNTNIFDPTNKEFNPLRAIELVSSPLHYTFALNEDAPGDVLIRDLVNGEISRDLNAYHGFVPKAQLHSRGLAAPSFGKIFRVKGERKSAFQGFYVGVGPYVELETDLAIDQRLIDVLGGDGNTYIPNTTFLIENISRGQAAGAITVGYRGGYSLPTGLSSSGSERDGIYVSVNYNFLKGFRSDSAAMNVRFDTDANGLVTLAPTTIPLTVDHFWSDKGKGLSVDVGTAVIVNHWEVDFAANGIGNHIDWEGQKRELLTLNSLLQGSSFTTTPLPGSTETLRIELPVRYLAGGAYHTDKWTVSSEFGHGLQDAEFRAGGEYRLAILEFRAGEHYKNKVWQPGAGAGLNITRHFGLDAAVYGNSNNAERKRKPALAMSLRLGGE
jgi:hypothetical protein